MTGSVTTLMTFHLFVGLDNHTWTFPHLFVVHPDCRIIIHYLRHLVSKPAHSIILGLTASKLQDTPKTYYINIKCLILFNTKEEGIQVDMQYFVD